MDDAGPIPEDTPRPSPDDAPPAPPGGAVPDEPVLPGSLLERLHRVESDLLLERYNRALEIITGRKTGLPVFRIDAMGYSPEVAAELADPVYLGQGADHPFFILLTTDQLVAPIVHPGAGFARGPFRRMATDLCRELAVLTLGEPVYGEFRHGFTRITVPEQLARIRHVTVAPMTPGGRLADARLLRRQAAELVESAHRWCDEPFIEEMLALSERVRGWASLQGILEARSYEVGPCFSPRFGGTYVWPERGVPDRTIVLTSTIDSPDVDESVVSVLLNEDNAAEFLLSEDLAAVDAHLHQMKPALLENTLSWIALDFLLTSGKPGDLLELTPAQLERRVRTHPTPPADFLELERARFEILHVRQGLPLTGLSARTRIRLLTPRPEVPEFHPVIQHLLSFMDPVDWSRLLRHAPDLFFARFQALDPARRALVAGWIRKQA